MDEYSGDDGGLGTYGGGYDPGQDINYVAIEALGKIGPVAKEAPPLLRKIVEQETRDEGRLGGGGGAFGVRLS